jgi:putative ABC transport system permease protein
LRDRRFSGAIGIVVALVVAVVLATTGRTAATERSVVSSIETLGARIVVLTDADRRAHIDPTSVGDVAAIDGVSWAFGLGPAESGQNAVMPQVMVVTTRALVGDLPSSVEMVSGRPAIMPDEALAGTTAVANLALGDVAGGVSTASRQVGVVGCIRSTGVLDFLNETVLYRTTPSSEAPVVQIYLAVDEPVAAQGIAQEALARLTADSPDSVNVEVSSSIIALSDVVSGKLGASSRQLMAVLLLVGLAINTAVTAAMVASHRRDFGRMRALGASRSALVVIVLTGCSVAAGGGALLGAVLGLVLIATSAATFPAWGFVAGVALSAVLVALLGAVVPAVLAARSDPVAILRVP